MLASVEYVTMMVRLGFLSRFVLFAAAGSAAAQITLADGDVPVPEAASSASDAGAEPPAAASDAETPPEDPASPAPAEEPKPKTPGDILFEQAIGILRTPSASREELPIKIREARALFSQVVALPEADVDDQVRKSAAMLHQRMGMALISYGTPEERESLVVEFSEDLLSREEIGDMEVAMMGALLEAVVPGDAERGAAMRDRFLAAIDAKGGEKATENRERLEGVFRRLTLLGQKLVLTGTTVSGERFDVASLEGKVVLVDFWATWCGPCRAEHPNMIENYEKYRDKGFEIVGVSLDKDREALDEFLAESPGGWLVLHDEGGKNPATRYYGVNGIPCMFLLDEHGVVISTEARGEELSRMLEERFGKVELPSEPEAPAAEEADAAPTAAAVPASDAGG